MKYWPNPCRLRPTHQFLWLVPMGRRCTNRRAGSSQDTAIHPRRRQQCPVDPVPHQLPDEAADLPEAADPVELDHPDRILVPALLRDEPGRAVNGNFTAGGSPPGKKYGFPEQVPMRGFASIRSIRVAK